MEFANYERVKAVIRWAIEALVGVIGLGRVKGAYQYLYFRCHSFVI